MSDKNNNKRKHVSRKVSENVDLREESKRKRPQGCFEKTEEITIQSL